MDRSKFVDRFTSACNKYKIDKKYFDFALNRFMVEIFIYILLRVTVTID